MTTLRLNMPQWQGGNDPAYHFGAQLLRFLAPAHQGPEETIAVPWPNGAALQVESGITARGALLAQARNAREAIGKHEPDRIVTLGGDCLVSLAPFAYLSARYGDAFGLLWVDAHPDVIPAEAYPNAHAHVLAFLLGEGDTEFAREVERPVPASRVMYAGLDEWRSESREVMARLNLARSPSVEVAHSSQAVLGWIARENIRQLAVHYDLDVLDPAHFRALNFNRTDRGLDPYPGVPRGKLLPQHVIRLLRDVSEEIDIVGLTIAEHMPWDTLAMRDMLKSLPLMGME